MRSLYSEIMLLPAYKLFRSREKLLYNISVYNHELKNYDNMKKLKFSSIETPMGKVTVDVIYVKNPEKSKVFIIIKFY